MNEVTEESTGITNRVITDWRSSPRGADLKPAMVIKDKKGEVQEAETRRRSPLSAVGGCHSVG